MIDVDSKDKKNGQKKDKAKGLNMGNGDTVVNMGRQGRKERRAWKRRDRERGKT